MRKHYRLYLVVCLTLLSFARTINSAILPSWNNKLSYHPDPLVFVHGMNSSPDAWGFVIDPRTEDVIGYIPITAYNLFQYFDNYLERNPDTGELLRYIEPFNYRYNTFDDIKWNAYEGYEKDGIRHHGEQYPDERIKEVAPQVARPALRVLLEGGDIANVSGAPVRRDGILSKYQTTKTNLVAHSLGGVVSRYYINRTQGANVKQLTTLGTPHKGALVAVVIPPNLSKPITDPLDFRRIWRVILIGLFSQIDLDREPFMIYELKPSSQFIKDLNSSIPAISRYYCIGGTVRGFPPPFIDYTDGFIELHSALAEERNFLPPVLPEDSQLRSILPNYKGRILVPAILNPLGYLENKHTKLPNKWEEILKAIDSTKPRVEITSPQEGFVWETGATITIEGKVYDEYLPADCSIKIELYKAGDNFSPVFSEVRKPDSSTGYTPLKPSDLWRADDPNSPVAEFREDVKLPSIANPEWTYTVKLTVTNPAEVLSDTKEVTEKTFYLYGVARDGSGVSKLWCIDGPTSFVDSVARIVQEIKLVDEGNNPIESNVLDVTSGNSYLWVSFDDKKIRRYNVYGEPEKLDSTNWYWTVSNMPDGLYYDGGSLQYCSSETNRLYRVSLSGVETDIGVVKRRITFDGVAPEEPYTDKEYTGYNPTGISTNYLCSSGKISKRNTTGRLGQNFIETLPTGTPIWTNEQDISKRVSGIVEAVDDTVTGGIAIYLSCRDGNVHKARFVDRIATERLPSMKWDPSKVEIRDLEGNLVYPVGYSSPPSNSSTAPWVGKERKVVETKVISIGGVNDPIRGNIGGVNGITGNIRDDTYRAYGKVVPPASFIEAFVTYSTRYEEGIDEWDGGQWIITVDPTSMASSTLSLCEDGEYDSPLITTLAVHSYGGTEQHFDRDTVVRVTDITNKIPKKTFYYTERYDNEGESLPIGPLPYALPMPVGFITHAYNLRFDLSYVWTFLTGNGSLEVLDKFAAPSGIWEGIGTGSRVNMRIRTGYPSSINVGGTIQFEAHGKELLKWITSDDTIGKVDTRGLFTGVGKGTCTVTVTDALGNIATSGAISVQ